jgi:hypothetical protein
MQQNGEKRPYIESLSMFFKSRNFQKDQHPLEKLESSESIATRHKNRRKKMLAIKRSRREALQRQVKGLDTDTSLKFSKLGSVEGDGLEQVDDAMISDNHDSSSTSGSSEHLDDMESIEEDEQHLSWQQMDQEKLRQSMLESRRSRRTRLKAESQANGEVDTVVRNSGPPLELLPIGYLSAPEAPSLTDDDLTYRKIMYRLRDSKNRDTTWQLATIIGSSNKPGCNYRIKLDKSNIKNIGVESIQKVSITMAGDNAYGHRWILLEKKLFESLPI